MGMYGFSSATWLLNLIFGGNGGRTHSLFYQVSQLMQVAPAVAAWHAMKVQRSYVTNEVVYDDYDYDATLEYLYDPEEMDPYSFNYYDPIELRTRLAQFYLLAAVNLVVNTYTIGNIKADYQVQKAHHDAMKAAAEGDEDHEEEEPAEEEPAAEEEQDPFF